MAKDRLHRLKREELLDILLDQTKELEKLRKENEELKEKLASRQVMVEEAGNLADASLQICRVLEAAQEAADLYLENVRRMAQEKPAGGTAVGKEAE